MAKMFYTLTEVAEKLGKSEDDVREMATSGQIQEFRDRDKLMFKVDQIDLLIGGEEDSDEVVIDLDPGAASGSGLGLEQSETSALGLTDSRDGTGISVFETDHGGEEDAAATHASGAPLDDELSLESVGSGSGLLDLTRESDDTSLGAELLDEVYSSDENFEIPANASGLFEAADVESAPEEIAQPTAVAMPMVAEVYDGVGSGLGIGVMVGSLVALICLAIIVFVGIAGSTPQLAVMFVESLWMWSGGLLAIVIVFGLVGMFLGKASE